MPNHEELLDILLKNRGIVDKNKFLNPKYEDLYDPYLLKGMEIAVIRIFEAVEAKEKIIIYTDYDCDGIPSGVIMHDFFKKIGYENFLVYIPHRHDEGYGLHGDAIDGFINDGINLLVTFDLGITAIDEVVKAKAGGIDVIIIDHHLPRRSLDKDGIISDVLPSAYAIINPKQEGCDYPEKMLCGGGLAFKLIQALLLKYREYWKINEGWEKWLLDMAGVATLSDQVPLLDENRILAYYGLKVLKKSRRPGLIEIFRKAAVDISKINEEDITFTLAPRLNAASRMANPMDAFQVLATSDPVLAKTLANHLVKINDERKQTVAHIMKEVKKTLNKRSLSREEAPVVVIGNPKWRVGVLGIVAAKITEEYKRPVFVWGGDEGDILRGSCRSYGDINLVEIMNLLPENSLLDFGGHKMAGGFSVSHEEIHFLEERIFSIFPKAQEENNKNNQEVDLPTDSVIEIDDITNENYKVIEKLAPFGEGNPKPTFLIKKAKIYSMKEFGKEKNHLEIVFKNSRGSNIKAIAFFKTNETFGNYLESGKEIDLVVNFEKNTFAGRTELRLRIIDIIIK